MSRLISTFLLGVITLISTNGFAEEGNAISDEELGLSKTSVREEVAPVAYNFNPRPPGTNETLPRAYLNAPPQIPHNIDRLTPVTMKSNQCRGCHDKPQMWGMAKRKGLPTPIPQSHYTDLRRDPGTVTSKLIGARFVCTQCHVPQASTEPLVQNIF